MESVREYHHLPKRRGRNFSARKNPKTSKRPPGSQREGLVCTEDISETESGKRGRVRGNRNSALFLFKEKMATSGQKTVMAASERVEVTSLGGR